jgi:hypothetical protein
VAKKLREISTSSPSAMMRSCPSSVSTMLRLSFSTVIHSSSSSSHSSLSGNLLRFDDDIELADTDLEEQARALSRSLPSTIYGHFNVATAPDCNV